MLRTRLQIEWKCWFLRRGENRSTWRKTSRSKREKQTSNSSHIFSHPEQAIELVDASLAKRTAAYGLVLGCTYLSKILSLVLKCVSIIVG